MLSLEQRGLLSGRNFEKIWPRTEHDTIPLTANYDIYRYQFPERLGDVEWLEAAQVFVRLGVLAPSSHNMQARLYTLNSQHRSLTVTVDGKYVGGPSDRTGREAVIGLGASAENIIQGFWAYNLRPKAKIVTTTIDGRQLAGVRFDFSEIASGTLVDAPALDLMKHRRVYRGSFKRDAQIDFSLWRNMVEAASQEGVRLELRRDSLTKTGLAFVQYAADNAVLQMPDFREELGEYIADNQTLKERVMPGSTFGLSDEDARMLHEQLSKGGLLSGRFAAGFPQADKDGIMSSQSIGIFIVEEDSARYWLKAGMSLQRTWLYAQAHGLGVGIMAGMVEVGTKARELLAKLGIQKGAPAGVIRLGVPRRTNWPRSPRVSNMNDILRVE